MKCKYSYCKNNFNVEKENAIKIGNSYYCKECYEEKQTKQQIEEYYITNMPSTTLQLLRKVIKQLIHEKGLNSKYVLFVLKYIHINKKPINNPFGLLNYCNEGRMVDLYNKQITNMKYKEIKDNINSITEEKVDFKYKPNIKKWTDLM